MIRKTVKGIYLIERLTEETTAPKYYVGQAIDIFERFNEHCNGRNQYIDKEINKIGYDKFNYRILEIVEKQSDLNECETKWIKYYKNLYGDKSLYNIVQTTNINPYNIDKNLKKTIKELFKKDIGRSIYAISEYFNIPWQDVITIRKPILKSFNLIYSKDIKNIVDKETMTVPDNWRGPILTQKLATKILTDIQNGVDKKDIDYVAKADITIFLNSYNENYEYASEIIL